MTDSKKDMLFDMSEDMKNDALQQAKAAVELYKIESKISQHIKNHFDSKYGPTWHCIVGKSFNSFVSYESKNYIFFYEGQLAILLYRMG